MSNGGDQDHAKGVGVAAVPCAQLHDDTGSPRVINSVALLNGRSQLAILHNETLYFLRQTRFGKLILTK